MTTKLTNGVLGWIWFSCNGACASQKQPVKILLIVEMERAHLLIKENKVTWALGGFFLGGGCRMLKNGGTLYECRIRWASHSRTYCHSEATLGNVELMFGLINRVAEVIWPPWTDLRVVFFFFSIRPLLAFKSLLGGQITLSTLLTKPNIHFYSPTNTAPQFL